MSNTSFNPSSVLQQLGAGSGIDTRSLATSLVEAERAPRANLINERIEKSEARITGLGAIRFGLSELERAFSALNQRSDFSGAVKAESSQSAFTAEVSAQARADNHLVKVDRIATAQRSELGSGFASRDTLLNGGNPLQLAFSKGGITRFITVDSTSIGGITPQGVATALNDAGLGLRAELIDTGGTSATRYRLTVTGELGEDNAFTLSERSYAATAQAGTTTAGQDASGSDPASAGSLTFDGASSVTLSDLTANRSVGDRLRVTLDGTRTLDFTLSAGTGGGVTAQSLTADLNQALQAAYGPGLGAGGAYAELNDAVNPTQLVIRSDTTGAASAVALGVVSAFSGLAKGVGSTSPGNTAAEATLDLGTAGLLPGQILVVTLDDHPPLEVTLQGSGSPASVTRFVLRNELNAALNEALGTTDVEYARFDPDNAAQLLLTSQTTGAASQVVVQRLAANTLLEQATGSAGPDTAAQVTLANGTVGAPRFAPGDVLSVRLDAASAVEITLTGSGTPPVVTSVDLVERLNTTLNQVRGTTGVSYAAAVDPQDHFSAILLTSPTTGTGSLVVVEQRPFTNPAALPTSRTLQAARDASLVINGVEVTRSSNRIEDAIEGVTLNLVDTTNGTARLSLSRDTADIQQRFQNLVTAYNEFDELLQVLGDRESNIKDFGGAMAGDRLLNTVRTQVRAMFTYAQGEDRVQGGSGDDALQYGYQVGFSFDRTGKLTLDETRLEDVLRNRFEDVVTLFTNNTDVERQFGQDRIGLAAEAVRSLRNTLRSSQEALIFRQETTVRTELERHRTDLQRLEARMELLLSRYVRQFAAMESIIGRTNSLRDGLQSTFEGMMAMYTNRR
jgi:flagellar hook-associated protein 2